MLMLKAAVRTLAVVGLAFASTSAAVADGDIAKGEKVFKKCQTCHAVGPAATNRVGPILNGIVGKSAGKVAKYTYSPAMKSSGLTWDKATLKKYLKDPKALVPGTKMVFVGLKKDDELENVIAYLASFKSDGSRTQ
jgi:cytochrome c